MISATICHIEEIFSTATCNIPWKIYIEGLCCGIPLERCFSLFVNQPADYCTSNPFSKILNTPKELMYIEL